ncbi:hypothetical protein C8R44DRAFT_892677 [Mycena epipterygia]|nr:hypothetical protein C8R44DRAFT_892677 [Mycena epipterygia]
MKTIGRAFLETATRGSPNKMTLLENRRNRKALAEVWSPRIVLRVHPYPSSGLTRYTSAPFRRYAFADGGLLPLPWLSLAVYAALLPGLYVRTPHPYMRFMLSTLPFPLFFAVLLSLSLPFPCYCFYILPSSLSTAFYSLLFSITFYLLCSSTRTHCPSLFITIPRRRRSNRRPQRFNALLRSTHDAFLTLLTFPALGT